MTITIGWWVLPVLITIISLVVAYARTPEAGKGGYIPDMTPLFVFGYNLVAALVVSLLAWTLYAIYLVSSHG